MVAAKAPKGARESAADGGAGLPGGNWLEIPRLHSAGCHYGRVALMGKS